ncbi:hypothetical protein ACEYW6_24145 [Nostoc sp. UIC 10607]
MEVLESSIQGIKGRWRGTNKSNEAWKYIDFVAPSLVLNTAYSGSHSDAVQHYTLHHEV